MRKLVTIRKVKELKPIDGADRIEVAVVDGWNVVVKKGEFNAGDLCVYFEIDSLIPRAPWNDFLVSNNKFNEPVRLRTVKLRGQISQGLALPLDAGVLPYDSGLAKEGDDITDAIGVEKYEPPIPASLGGDYSGKIPYSVTDEERIQNIPDIINEFKNREVYITQKIDGTSTTFGIKDGNFIVAGRNWAFKEGVQNTYWDMAHKYDMERRLRELGEATGYEWAVQGETYGEGIQKNRLGIKGHEFAIFNVIRNGIKVGMYDADHENYPHWYSALHPDFVPHVRCLYKGPFTWASVEELLAYADEHKYPNGAQGEGIVIRPVVPFYCSTLNTQNPSFKVISNKFLSKNKDA